MMPEKTFTMISHIHANATNQIISIVDGKRDEKLKRIDVAVLGATGRVGLEYLEMLKDHPWFRVVEATGNTKVGMKLGEVAPDLPAEMRSI